MTRRRYIPWARLVKHAGSQKALAAALGIKPAYVSLLQSGKRKPSDRLYKDIVAYMGGVADAR